MQGYKQQKAFIIAQGPMESTCRDFWKMVCDRTCGVVVMLSRLNEEGKVGGLQALGIALNVMSIVSGGYC